jgi:predicted dehydrogenase
MYTFSPDRRQFAKAALAGSALPLAMSSSQANANVKADTTPLRLGFIGLGMMGRGHLGSFLGMNDVQVVGISEVVKERLDSAMEMVAGRNKDRKDAPACKAHVDYRELLDRKDIDAVVIATPDHWHALNAIHAARAGKHIYCEKPLTRTVAEGRRLVTEVAKANVTFQTGSQQRSEFDGRFRMAAEIVRNGRLGKIHTVRIGVGVPAIACNLSAEEVPAGTDWDKWMGPSPKRAFNHELCPLGIHRHFPAWRSYREYAGGGLADMGAHHFDIAQWALEMDASGPVKIEPPAKENIGLKYTYANGVVMFHGGPSGCTFEGSEGTLYVDRGVIKASKEEVLKEPFTDKDKRVYFATNHRRNWIECIRNQKPTICPAEVGHRSATICHLGNIGYWTRRNLVWDPVKERFANDDEANGWLDHEDREPYRLG